MTDDNFPPDLIELAAEGDDRNMADHFRYYCETYRELAELIGEAAVIKIWRNYSGLTITFPRQLYSRDYIREYIRNNAGVLKPAEIARNVGLTERRVRQIIHEQTSGHESKGAEND